MPTNKSISPTRRDILRVGGLSTFGLTLEALLRNDAVRAAASAKSAKKSEPTADACILIFLTGGPPHLDMWDMKPEGPAEIRGEFKPIATSVPGLQICEHLPKMAKLMHHATVVRSMHHSVNNSHAAAVHCGLTGHDRGEAGGGGAKPTDHPAIGSVLSHLRPSGGATLPYVALPYISKEGAGGPPQPGVFGGWLGKSHDPLFVLRDPNKPEFAMPELGLSPDVDPARFDARKKLLSGITRGDADQDKALAELDSVRGRAFDLLTAQTTRDAFRINQESNAVRDAYGRNIYGQSTLLARRLIEAGTRLACVTWAPDANATWDTHGNNFKKLKGELLPQLDLAVTALLNDLQDRGRLSRTVVAIMGEFGRSPKINGGAGRDHWNFCYSLMLCGGGFRGGYVHGASDKIGGRPSLNPLTPADIIATIYSCLGIAHDTEIRDKLDRPSSVVPWGQPVRALLA